MLGMAYLEGRGVEKDDHAAYYWLRMAELNSSNVFEQSCSAIHGLRSSLIPEDIQKLEQEICRKAHDHQKRRSQRVSEGFQPEAVRHSLAT
jgi:TPR repeat protein